jgi:hypothetical protein
MFPQNLVKGQQRSCLRNLNHKLLEQIKFLKAKRKENAESKNKIDKSEDKEEILRLKRHNHELLIQIKNTKHDKNSLQGDIYRKKSIVDKETMTKPMELEIYLDVKIPNLDKRINIDSVNLTTQKDANLANVKKSLNV